MIGYIAISGNPETGSNVIGLDRLTGKPRELGCCLGVDGNNALIEAPLVDPRDTFHTRTQAAEHGHATYRVTGTHGEFAVADLRRDHGKENDPYWSYQR